MTTPGLDVVSATGAAPRRGYWSRTEPLPRAFEKVDAAWLTRTLQNRYPDLVVEAMAVEQFVGSHTTKVRIKVELNAAGKAAGLPDHLCLKSNWSGAFETVDICGIEARFYHNLRDQMLCPTPLCYYADWDSEGVEQGLIVLEDLTQRGGSFGNSLQHTGVAGVERALKGLAQLHATFWGDPLLERQAWLQTSMATPVDNDQIRMMWSWIQINLAKPDFRAALPQAFLDDPGRLQRAFDGLIAWEAAQTSPRCLILGDCHVGNTYLKPDGERIWLDWQLVRRGRPWRDLTYFMIGSLSVEERRTSERDLIKVYREGLLAAGVAEVPSLDDIFEQYRRWAVYGMQAWIANMDEWGQPGLPMVQRFYTAGEDIGTWSALGLD